MIEAYAFLAAFTVQIFVLSVLHPVWFTKYARAKAQVQLPGWDSKSFERVLGLYRVVNAGIAVLGLVLLSWLFTQMQSPDWNVGLVTRWQARYVLLQISPFFLAAWLGVWIKTKARTQWPPEVKRTASLQRRRLFDIVSPFTICLSVLAYFLFAAFVIAIEQHPFPGLLGYRLLAMVTLNFALNAFVVYWLMYRRKRWPVETRAYRMQTLGGQVKVLFYISIAVIIFLSAIVTLRLLDLLRWPPFAISFFIVTIMLLASTPLFALRRQAEADRLGPSAAER